MPGEVEELISRLFVWNHEREGRDHPLLLATSVHAIFVRIHPFVDGNGRVARLLSNWILMKHDYPPSLYASNSARSTLNSWDDKKTAPLTTIMADLMEEMFQRFEKEL